MTSRETFTSALAGPLVKARATSAGVAPWAPTPGSNRIARGRSLRASPTARGCVAPMTAPTDDKPCSPTRSAPHSATSSATWCQTCRPSERTRSCTSAPPALDVLTTQKMPAPSRRHAARNGSSESRPRYGFTVTASASGGLPFDDSRYAAAYARAVEPMSPRFASAITCNPAAREYAQTSSRARTPSAPSASKNATCGLTATTYGATASTRPRQKRSQAAAACSRPRWASPFSSTGRWSGRGSSPTTSWERFRSTASAKRSAKFVVATAATPVRVLLVKDAKAPLVGAGPAALHGRLELTPCGELGHRGCRNRHFLRRIAGIHALALCAPLGHEFSEAREGHFPAAMQRVGDRVEEGVYGLRRIATGEIGAPRDLVNELLFRQVPLLLSTNRTTGKDPNSSAGLAQPCGFAGLLSRGGRSLARF